MVQSLAEFNDELERFFRSIDGAHNSWCEWSGSHPSDDYERCMNEREIAKLARHGISENAHCQVELIAPPVGQSAVQFIASILDDVENAWHLLRFMHCIKVNANEIEADFRRIQQEMRERLPALRNSLWESWRHIAHILELLDSTSAENIQVKWQAARDELLKMMRRGDRFTSYEKLAESIGCSPSTMHKAVKQTAELQPWATKQRGSATGMVNLDGCISDSIAQTRESDPSDILEQPDVDRALAYLRKQ